MSTSKRLCALHHPREPWQGDEQIYACTRWERLKRHESYPDAKGRGDALAADLVVRDFHSDPVMDRLVDDVTPFMEAGREIRVVLPHPPFDDGNGLGSGLERRRSIRNAIPFQFAAHVATNLDAQIDTNITQIARVGRTKLTKFERFLYHPVYNGTVRPGDAYILVDDVHSQGGTLAALRSYIVSQGGVVRAFAVVASRTGQWLPLALSRETCEQMDLLYGPSLRNLWVDEIGHDTRCLTEAEGRTLTEWAQPRTERGESLVQCLRDSLASTASEGVRRDSRRGRG